MLTEGSNRAISRHSRLAREFPHTGHRYDCCKPSPPSLGHIRDHVRTGLFGLKPGAGPESGVRESEVARSPVVRAHAAWYVKSRGLFDRLQRSDRTAIGCCRVHRSTYSLEAGDVISLTIQQSPGARIVWRIADYCLSTALTSANCNCSVRGCVPCRQRIARKCSCSR